jgi:hypothetical protein
MNSRQPQFAIARKPLPQPSVVGHNVSSGPSPIELSQIEPNPAEPYLTRHNQTELILTVSEESITSEEVSDTQQECFVEHLAAVQVQNVEQRRDTSTAPRRSCCGLCRHKGWPTEPNALPKFSGRLWLAKTETLLVSVASGFLGEYNLNSNT